MTRKERLEAIARRAEEEFDDYFKRWGVGTERARVFLSHADVQTLYAVAATWQEKPKGKR